MAPTGIARNARREASIAVHVSITPGVAALRAVNFGGQSMVALNYYRYGDQAAATVAPETPCWEAWFQERFPMPSETSQSE